MTINQLQERKRSEWEGTAETTWKRSKALASIWVRVKNVRSRFRERWKGLSPSAKYWVLHHQVSGHQSRVPFPCSGVFNLDARHSHTFYLDRGSHHQDSWEMPAGQRGSSETWIDEAAGYALIQYIHALIQYIHALVQYIHAVCLLRTGQCSEGQRGL